MSIIFTNQVALFRVILLKVTEIQLSDFHRQPLLTGEREPSPIVDGSDKIGQQKKTPPYGKKRDLGKCFLHSPRSFFMLFNLGCRSREFESRHSDHKDRIDKPFWAVNAVILKLRHSRCSPANFIGEYFLCDFVKMLLSSFSHEGHSFSTYYF